MSRRAFRIDVADPRPASAWALVTLACASLWITQQLAVWVLAVQGFFLLYSLATRANPQRWQKSPLALNVGMFFIVFVTIRVALRGGPSTIALAYFAALTQALQLVDARPRRTEFLLVALALFQVVLASNLTDSVLFPPLLIAFTFAAAWTLIVHTLRSEALEAGDHAAASRALTPGVVKMTFFATGVSVALALVIFVVLPRLQTSVVTSSSMSRVTATSGFSDKVALGALGSIRQDPTVVMRVETTFGKAPSRGEAYWRGLAFDRFDGSSWSITPHGHDPVPGSAEGGVTFTHQPDRVNLVQSIVRDPVEAGVLFGIGLKRGLQGTIRRLETDSNGGLYARAQSHERVRYTVDSERIHWADSVLTRDAAEPPKWKGDRYLQLPELSDAVAILAREITREKTSDAEKARTIERYLFVNGRYSDTPPTLEDSGGESTLEHFLFQSMAAHCEYYASAFVVLARSVGLPARLVNGFAGGRTNRIGDFVEVTRADAHAWAEVHYNDAGWVRYDATPPDLRVRALTPPSLEDRAREVASAMELWWFQRVVGFDRSDQIHAMKRAWSGWSTAHKPGDELARTDKPAIWKGLGSAPWREGTVLALCAAGIIAALWWLRPRTHRKGLPAAYADGLEILARHGFERAPQTTARDFAAAIRAAHPAAGPPFEAITESYLGERFGDFTDPVDRHHLAALRESLTHATRAPYRRGSIKTGR
jgi:transglutaminase-like putative cysteine protease